VRKGTHSTLLSQSSFAPPTPQGGIRQKDQPTMPFAILRFQKLKASSVGGSSAHMTRARDTPNADPSRASLNTLLVGTDDPAADVGQRARLATRNRKDGVRAIEVLMTFSPEWAGKDDPAKLRAWMDVSHAWLVQTFGRDNLVHLRLHADESTPHLTGFVVPLDPKTGRLNAKGLIGGSRVRLRELQTSYAQAVAPCGLERGVAGSQRRHEEVQDWYARTARRDAQLHDRERDVMDRSAQLAAQQAEIERLRREVEDEKAKAAAARAAAEKIKADLGNERTKLLYAYVRTVPVDQVVAELQRERGPLTKVIRDPRDPDFGQLIDTTRNRPVQNALDVLRAELGNDALPWMIKRYANEMRLARAADSMTPNQQRGQVQEL
jgi:Plasmid recombination enzyme.